jgi:hypothetical protein
VLLPGVEEVELGAATFPGDTVQARALTIATRAGRFDRAASISEHGEISATGSAFGVDSVFTSFSWFSPPLVKLLNLRSRVNQRLTLAIVHQGDADKAGTEEGGGRGEQGSESAMAHSRAFRQAGVGSSGFQDTSESSRSLSIEEQSRYNLCIGTFGSIPIDCEFVRPGQGGFDGSGSPSPGSEFHIASTASTAIGEGYSRREFDMQKRIGSSEEKADETSFVFAICCSSPSRQVDSKDVETDPGGLWSNQEG